LEISGCEFQPYAYGILMSSNSSPNKNLNKVMLGFIVRRCAVDLGHSPTPDEFAARANEQEENGQRFSIFGQPISPSAAKVMLRHLGRLVAVHSDSLLQGTRGDLRKSG
jgi:hypothetical protein